MGQTDVIVFIVLLVAFIFILVILSHQRAQVAISTQKQTYYTPSEIRPGIAANKIHDEDNQKQTYYTPSEIRSVIAAKKIHDEQNQLAALKSRSLPNESLQRTFGIQNAFTSAEEADVRDFVKNATSFIKVSSDSWAIIASTTQDAVERWKEYSKGPCSARWQVQLVPMIQSITLYAVLTAFSFLKKDTATKDDVPLESLSKLAEAINNAWIMSKNKDTLVEFEHNDKLRKALIEVFPYENISNPPENPLNLILPGFETMWRIVLRVFLEVAYKTGKGHPNWREALISFSEKPTAEKFNQEFSPDGVSANHLVKEALRLYPPTKRINRAWNGASSSEPKEIAADIEACHLSMSIWGETAGEFDPLRWEIATREQLEAFLPFGSKPFECPARPLFGPRLIGLLVGTLLRAFPHNWTLTLESSIDSVEFGPERLSNERSGFHDLYLI